MMLSTPAAAPARPGASARILVTIFFAGLLATPYLVRRFSPARQPAGATIDRQAALTRYGFYLEEVSHSAGVDFVHQAPMLDSKLAPSCRKSHPWALRFPLWISIVTDGPTSM
jgi:hypothetical protein